MLRNSHSVKDSSHLNNYRCQSEDLGSVNLLTLPKETSVGEKYKDSDPPQQIGRANV